VFCGDNPVNFVDPLGLANVFLYGRGGHTSWENINLAGMGNSFDYSYEVSGLTDAANVVARLAQSGVNIDLITIAGHGTEAGQFLGDEMLSPSSEKCPKKQTQIQKIGASLSSSGILQLLGCNVAGAYPGMNGPEYIQNIANEANRPVVAYTGKTWFTIWGSANFGDTVIRAPR